ncbi:sigma-70 family RNA polymerase sigma factor [Streptomyces sp. L2]|uniref:sigma-70 family RNA polymerase sigma factor n=1 Tax=Streptomyces sp. L2 TaxID=2162665 RepID=UPI001011FF12|nr:sigma-70 family RNA polymerase sigma factor [Streptomyces sp. L2]
MLSNEEQQQSRSDADITAAVREGDDEALTELYRRHQPAVLAYARICCRDPDTAEDLTSEAFARALQAVRAGSGPELAWRHYLLTIVRRTAAGWADTARRTELSPDFAGWLAAIPEGPEAESSEERVLRLEDRDLMLRGFRALPERWRAVLWHTVIENEPAAQVGSLLGMTASGVASLAARAREGLREAYLSAHAERGTASAECRHHAALLGAAVRRSGRHTSRVLDRHLAQCLPCRQALEHLTDVNERLPTALPVGLLLWGGPAYVAARCAGADATAAAVAGHATLAGPKSLWSRAKVSAPMGAALATAVVAAGLGGFALLPQEQDNRSAPPTVPSARHADLAPSAIPSSGSDASSSPGHRPGKGSRRPTASTRPSRSGPPPSRRPTVMAQPKRPAGDTSRRLRVAITGGCMEIEGGRAVDGLQPHEAACDGSARQHWDVLVVTGDVNDDGLLHVQLRNGASRLCLTSSGLATKDAPVAQHACDSDDDLQDWAVVDDTSRGVASFVDTSVGAFLGLEDGRNAAAGRPHRHTIGTNTTQTDDEDAPCSDFIYDGTLLKDD